MSVYLSAKLRKRLTEADDHRCAYCHTAAANTGQAMTIDHILPQAQGGVTAFENLCYCCRTCNEFKGSQTTANDPLTGVIVALYHPRHDIWHEHFEWDESGTLIVGRSAQGKVTISALNMNHPVIVAARRRWVNVGWHPPENR